MVRPSLIDLNSIGLKYYPCTISLDKSTGSCNVISPKIGAPKKQKKGVNVKAFNMITNKNEAKTMTKHVSCDYKCRFNNTKCNSNLI